HTPASLSSIPRPPPRPTLFPYTTLFRSSPREVEFGRELDERRETGHPMSAAEYSGRLAETFDPAMAQELCERLARNRTWIVPTLDRKSTRLNSSHDQISYAVFCLKKKKK